ncbi:MAG: hypothetical protein R3F60_16020 [bacterium]
MPRASGACRRRVPPGAEICNGLDDDCDGEVDEGCGLDLDLAVLDEGRSTRVVDRGIAPRDRGAPPRDHGTDLGGACQPACAGRTCGPDGCGGDCGDCAGAWTCAGPTATRGMEGVWWYPALPCRGIELLQVLSPQGGHLRWGVDGWRPPPRALWPAGSVAVEDGTVETPLTPLEADLFLVAFEALGDVATLDFAIRHPDGTWDNNRGADYHIALDGEACPLWSARCVDEPAGHPPGSACTCDADCQGVDGFPGLCAYGVCYLRSDPEWHCPPGTIGAVEVERGFPVCAADCGSVACAGECHGRQCLPRAGLACDPFCATRCDCEPQCDGRTCGFDQCGGLCGECGDHQTCVDQTACACVAHWQGPDCQTCPANWDPDRNCNACLPHWDGVRCDTCRGNWEGDRCDRCLPPWAAADDCLRTENLLQNAGFEAGSVGWEGVGWQGRSAVVAATPRVPGVLPASGASMLLIEAQPGSQVAIGVTATLPVPPSRAQGLGTFEAELGGAIHTPAGSSCWLVFTSQPSGRQWAPAVRAGQPWGGVTSTTVVPAGQATVSLTLVALNGPCLFDDLWVRLRAE